MTSRPQFPLRHLCALILFVAMTHACLGQGTTPQDTVATFEGQRGVTLGQLEQYVRDYPYGIMYRDRPREGYSRALDDMISNQLKRRDFFALGFADSAVYRGKMERAINEELVISYFKTRYEARYLNEPAFQREYARLGRVVTFREVRIPITEGTSRARIDALTALASRIEKRWRAGEDPAVFASRISSGAPLTVNDAEQTMTWSMSMQDDGNASIFDLTPGIIKVIHDVQGIRVVKILGRDMVAVPPIEEARAELQKGIEEKYAARIQTEFERDKRSLINEDRVRWNTGALARIVVWSNIPRFYQSGYGDTLRSALANGRNAWILRAPGITVDLKEFLRLLNDVLVMGEFNKITREDVQRFLLEAARTNMIVQKAKALGLERNVLVAESKNPVISDGILRLYNQYAIENRIPQPTDGALHAFYTMNKDSLYYQFAKVNLYVIPDSTPGPLEALKRRSDSGTPFEKLVPTILVKTYIRARNGMYNTYLGTEPPYLAAVAFSLSLHEVAGPVAYEDPVRGPMYALVKCAGTQKEQQLSYENVAHRIREDYRDHHRALMEAELRSRLKSKYAVVMRTHVIDRYLDGRRASQQ